MRQSYKSKTLLIIDNGIFVEMAVKLSKWFGAVYYYSPWESAFPKSNPRLIGCGLEGVIRVNDIWTATKEYPGVMDIDLIMFPDVYFGGLQNHLVSLGKRVFGGRLGDELELYRDDAKKLFKSLGLPVSPYAVVKGVANLRSYLKEHKKQWVKVSLTRGDFETFYAKDYKNIEPVLDSLEHTLGARKTIAEFIVEDAIEDAVETGYDGYCIDGKYPNKCFRGIEIKDLGYIMKVGNYADCPKEITTFNAAIAPTLKSYQYRGFMSTEIRVTPDHTSYMIDQCARQGSPPSELYQNMITNLPDILWYGAEGECVDPECDDVWGVEVLIHSQWADANWQNVQFPAAIRDNIKLRNACVIDGEYYAVPQSLGLPEIGAVVASAKTMSGAIEKVKKLCAMVEGYYITCHVDCIDKAQTEIDKLEKMGIKL